MKKFLKLGLVAFCATVVSCEDATDIIQESELGDNNVYRTVEDLESGLIGVYSAYTPDNANNGIGDSFFFSDVFTDNVKEGLANNGQGSEEFQFTLQPGSNSARIIYQSRYQTINFANRVLRALDQLAPTFNEEDLVQSDRIKGELLAMRALAHFDVLQYYVEDYSAPGSLGIQILNFVPEINQDVPRSTVGESFAFIKADLDAADELLDEYDGERPNFFVNDDVVRAIRAKVALVEGDYTLAESLSEQLLEDYMLASGDAYRNLWEDDIESTTEDIFVLSRIDPTNDPAVGENWYTNTVDRDGAVLLEMSRQLYDLYPEWDIRGRGWDNTNTQTEGVFVDEDSRPGQGIILIGKYPGGNSRGQLTNHIKLIRASEMQLIKAECEARRSAYGEAAASIQALWTARRRTGFTAPPVPTLTSDNALHFILEERRKELAFEGHRYLDLKRIGREIGVGVNRLASDCSSFVGNVNCALAPTDYRWTMPIPATEVNANPSIQQNTGY